MKIYMSVDMEGATGVVRSEQTKASRDEYRFGQTMQTHDLKAAIEGALEGGAREILVNDSHDGMINISPSDLSGYGGQVRIISGSPKKLGMMEGVEDCNGAFFLCYHAMAGTVRAILDHTISGRAVYGVRLNGKEVGEIGLNAAVCSEHSIPVLLVTGDTATCEEARSTLGQQALTCSVKRGIGHSSADCLPPDETFEIIRKGAFEAAKSLKDGEAGKNEISRGAFQLDISFHYTSQADNAATIPGTTRVDGRTVRIEGTGMDLMRRWAGSLISLGGSVAF
ncbi:MAG: M55 family metallopeptidase [Synergistota bacterium]|nr:M55 family metallopeptidase [Synergistota bacterium]